MIAAEHGQGGQHERERRELERGDPHRSASLAGVRHRTTTRSC
jgi:hypothetical protein